MNKLRKSWLEEEAAGLQVLVESGDRASKPQENFIVAAPRSFSVRHKLVLVPSGRKMVLRACPECTEGLKPNGT